MKAPTTSKNELVDNQREISYRTELQYWMPFSRLCSHPSGIVTPGLHDQENIDPQ